MAVIEPKIVPEYYNLCPKCGCYGRQHEPECKIGIHNDLTAIEKKLRGYTPAFLINEKGTFCEECGEQITSPHHVNEHVCIPYRCRG